MTAPFELYFARAFRAGPGEASVRTPELRSLGAKTIAQFGVGCLGAASALEFVRAGIGELRILDRDHVDPGTIGRWPLGAHCRRRTGFRPSRCSSNAQTSTGRSGLSVRCSPTRLASPF